MADGTTLQQGHKMKEDSIKMLVELDIAFSQINYKRTSPIYAKARSCLTAALLEQLESISFVALRVHPISLQLQLVPPSQCKILVVINITGKGFVINIL